jgi:hypothetical protein
MDEEVHQPTEDMRLVMVVDNTVWEQLEKGDEIDRQLFNAYMEKRAKFSYDSYRHHLTEMEKPVPAWLDEPINYFVWHGELGELFQGDLKEMAKGPAMVYCYWVPESVFQEWKKEEQDKGIDSSE